MTHAAHAPAPAQEAMAPAPGRGAPEAIDERARRWLTRLLLLSERSPMAARLVRRFFLEVSWHTASALRTGTMANAARLLGRADAAVGGEEDYTVPGSCHQRRPSLRIQRSEVCVCLA